MRDNKTKGCSNCAQNKGGKKVTGCANKVSDCATEKSGPKSKAGNKMSD